ncbi:MAG TPA: hypothetical protein VGG48_03230 [Rhizomicrobium sp.]|jgi:hypothetical protein
MADVRALQRAVIVGTVLQVALALLGHFSEWVALHAFWFGGMMISATASYLYAQDIGPGYYRGTVVGAIIGGGCALVGFAVSGALGDITLHDYLLRAAVSVVCGAAGGPFGQMSFNLKRLGY